MIKTRTAKTAAVIIFAALLSSVIYIFSPLLTGSSIVCKLKIEDISDILFFSAFFSHIIWALSLAALRKKENNPAVRTSEVFIVISLMFFLFTYLYAANAGLDYVQRFAASSDVLSFAPDTKTERLISVLLYLPFLSSDICAMFLLRKVKVLSLKFLRLSLTLLSSVLYALSFPSFININGYGFVIFFSFVPLLFVLKNSGTLRGIFYGITFGIFQTMIINYWLATFSLVSLQFVTLLYTALFTLFMIFSVSVYKNRYGWALFPFAWVVFEWARSSGFSAYPWCLTASAAYRFLPLIQTASLTGIWGVSFIILLINTSMTEILVSESSEKIRRFIPAYIAGLLTLILLLWGHSEIKRENSIINEKTVTLSLIQQNSDPRKTDYEESFEVLKNLTDSAVKEADTDLVVWSETAYVPNIRRWGSMERDYNSLTSLTHRFLEYQKKAGIYLVTGNDDYEITTSENGDISRSEYNASVFFTSDGERAGTYRKIKLVPFTEYFPYKKELPWLYDILINMDVNLWEPGKVRTVFRHPEFSFSTPICFEDIFPDYVRGFVERGCDIIINISNDYWSLTETEGMQHFINSLFRAVENRRYVVRATASGLTGVIDRKGEIIQTAPFYVQYYLNAEIPLEKTGKTTLYTKFGDWFPLLSALVFFLSFIIILLKKLIKK